MFMSMIFLDLAAFYTPSSTFFTCFGGSNCYINSAQTFVGQCSIAHAHQIGYETDQRCFTYLAEQENV